MQQANHSPRRPSIDYAALKQLVTIEQVLRLADWQPITIQGSQLRGPCFIHGSSRPHSRSLSVNIDRNVYQCFAPSCNSKGNQIDLAAAYFDLPLYEAARELCNQLNLEPPTRGTEKRN